MSGSSCDDSGKPTRVYTVERGLEQEYVPWALEQGFAQRVIGATQFGIGCSGHSFELRAERRSNLAVPLVALGQLDMQAVACLCWVCG